MLPAVENYHPATTAQHPKYNLGCYILDLSHRISENKNTAQKVNTLKDDKLKDWQLAEFHFKRNNLPIFGQAFAIP